MDPIKTEKPHSLYLRLQHQWNGLVALPLYLGQNEFWFCTSYGNKLLEWYIFISNFVVWKYSQALS